MFFSNIIIIVERRKKHVPKYLPNAAVVRISTFIRTHLFAPITSKQLTLFGVSVSVLCRQRGNIYTDLSVFLHKSINLMICCLWQQMAKCARDGQHKSSPNRKTDEVVFLLLCVVWSAFVSQIGERTTESGFRATKPFEFEQKRTHQINSLRIVFVHPQRRRQNCYFSRVHRARAPAEWQGIVCILCKLYFMLVVRQSDKYVYARNYLGTQDTRHGWLNECWLNWHIGCEMMMEYVHNLSWHTLCIYKSYKYILICALCIQICAGTHTYTCWLAYKQII